MPSVLAIVLTVVAATAAGIALERRDNGLAHRLRAQALRLMLWALLPFVIYVNLAHVQLDLDGGASLAVGLAATILAGTLAWQVTDRALDLPRPHVGAAIVCTLQANSGYLGLPLCAALFSETELAQAVAYDSLTSLPLLVLASFPLGAAFGGAGDVRWRARLRGLARNPVVLAAIAGALAPASLAPAPLVDLSQVAIYALLPLGFLVVGITLGDEAEEGALRVPPPLTRDVAIVVALRMAFVPAVLALLGALVLDVPTPFLVLAAMPVGVNTIVVAHATGLDLRLPAAAIAWSTTIAMAAIAALALAGVAG